MATEQNGHTADKSIDEKQYDKIGTKYNAIKQLPAAEPEAPSIIAMLGDIKGKRCLDLGCGTGKYTALLASLGAASVHGYDISASMIDGARATYPPSTHPNLTFDVADCSIPGAITHNEKFDIVHASWLLNYAGTEPQLTDMFRVILSNLNEGGRFVGITTDVHDLNTREPKMDFYGLDVLVLDPAYVAPDTGMEVGIKARVVVKGDTPFQFDVFQFRKEVYERCAERAGLRISWREVVLPDDERKGSAFWDSFVKRPTFSPLEAVRL